MTLRPSKIAAHLGLILLGLVCVSLGSLVATAWHARYQASRLLMLAEDLLPGIAREKTRETLHSFRGLREGYGGSGDPEKDIYWVGNCAAWTIQVSKHLPDWFATHICILPWTVVYVRTNFRDGALENVELVEMQEDPGYSHPYSAHVHYLPTLRQDEQPVSVPPEFTGYLVSSDGTGVYDANQKLVDQWTNRVTVLLDERATPAQLAHATNFQLRCMTSFVRCDDVKKILPIEIPKSDQFH